MMLAAQLCTEAVAVVAGALLEANSVLQAATAGSGTV